MAETATLGQDNKILNLLMFMMITEKSCMTNWITFALICYILQMRLFHVERTNYLHKLFEKIKYRVSHKSTDASSYSTNEPPVKSYRQFSVDNVTKNKLISQRFVKQSPKYIIRNKWTKYQLIIILYLKMII